MTVNQKAITKHVVALVMALIMLVLLPVNAFAHSSGGGSHSGGADLTSDSNKTYAYYPDCGLYFASTGSVPLIASSDISAYFSSFPNPSILYSHLHVLYNNSSYPDVSIYPDYIVYISTWGRASVVFFDYRNPRWSKVTLTNNVIHFEGMEQKNYFSISGIYCSNSSSDSFGHYESYIYPVQNMQYGQTKSLDDNFSGNINDNVYGTNCVSIISSTVPVYTSDGETVFEPEEAPGTFDESEPDNLYGYDSIPDDNFVYDGSDSNSPVPEQGIAETDNHYTNTLLFYLTERLNEYLGHFWVLLQRLYNRLISYFQLIRSYFISLTDNLNIMFNNLNGGMVRYVNGIITRMNFLNGKLLTALNDLKGVDENGFEAVRDALSHLQLSYDDSVTNTQITNDFSTVNNKLETVNSSIQDLSDLFKPSDGSTPATNIWDFLSTVAETLGGMVGSLADATSDIMRTLGSVIETALESLTGLLSELLTYLFVPSRSDLQNSLDNNVPAFAQIRSIFSGYGADWDPSGNLQRVSSSYQNIATDNSVHSFSFTLFPGADPVSFGFDDIPSGVSNGLYTASTLIAHVSRFFLAIKIFYKAFGLNVEGEG